MERREFLKKAGLASAALAGGPSLIQILEACGGGTPSQPSSEASPNFAKGGTIHLLQWSSFVPAADQKMQELMTRWASQHSGWTATLNTVASTDLQPKTSAAVQSQSGPDIIQMQYNWPWLYSGSCVDVGDVVDRLQKKYGNFYDTIGNDCKVKGKWLAVPYNYTTNAWTFRTDLWSKVGKPKFVDSLDDMLKYGKQVKDATGIPIGEALGHAIGDANTMWYGTLWNFGGKEVEKDGKTVAINSKETEQAVNWAIEMWRGALDQGGLSWDDSGNNRAYAAKTVNATQNGASVYLTAVKKDPALADVSDNAIQPKGPKARATIHLNMEHAVMRWTKNPGAAKDLVEYLMQKDVYAEWMTAGGGYNSYPNGLMDGHQVWTNPKIKSFNESVKLARWPGWPGPPSKASSEAQSRFIVVDMFATAVQNGDAKSAIKSAEQQLQAIYSKPA
jgi:multiple sugar transport system substrate-binding protein